MPFLVDADASLSESSCRTFDHLKTQLAEWNTVLSIQGEITSYHAQLITQGREIIVAGFPCLASLPHRLPSPSLSPVRRTREKISSLVNEEPFQECWTFDTLVLEFVVTFELPPHLTSLSLMLPIQLTLRYLFVKGFNTLVTLVETSTEWHGMYSCI